MIGVIVLCGVLIGAVSAPFALPMVAAKHVGHVHFASVDRSDASDALRSHNVTPPIATVVTDLARILSLRDYSTRNALLGTMLIGISAGVVGVFMLLRKRSLVGDVVGHSALPGIAIAFVVMEISSPGSGKWVPGLLIGATIAGLLGALSVIAIDRYSRIKSDAALAIVLSLFYGVGAALFTIAQRMPGGNSAGLKDYLNGKTASILAADVVVFAEVAVVILIAALLLTKEMKVLCFDEGFAAAEGYPVLLLDTLLVGLVVAVTIIGMQSVGLILVVAILIIPPAAARFWTDNLEWMMAISAVIGGASAFGGVVTSALFPRVAAGAVIVLFGSGLFVLSLLFGRERGLVRRLHISRRMRRQVGQLDLLRSIYEEVEAASAGKQPPTAKQLRESRITHAALERRRSWTHRELRRFVHRAVDDGLLAPHPPASWRLTKSGADEAVRVARNHRLWEAYLMSYADIAPTHVDRDADYIEHFLSPPLLRELEEKLADRLPTGSVPDSPHALTDADEDADAG